MFSTFYLSIQLTKSSAEKAGKQPTDPTSYRANDQPYEDPIKQAV
jgi:hypothetical protein